MAHAGTRKPVADLGTWRKIYKSAQYGERINAVSDSVECLFWRLLNVADDYGNLNGDPTWLLGHTFPVKRDWDAGKVTAAMAELCENRLVGEYESEHRPFFHIHEYEIRQSAPNGRRSRRFPPSPFDVVETPTGHEAGHSLVATTARHELAKMLKIPLDYIKQGTPLGSRTRSDHTTLQDIISQNITEADKELAQAQADKLLRVAQDAAETNSSSPRMAIFISKLKALKLYAKAKK